MKVAYHPEAQKELDETGAFYESRIPGLGGRFVDEVERASALLEEFPEIGRQLDRVFRQLSLRRYPYSLIYSAESDCVWIVAVAHNRRRPGYWRRRVGGT